MSNAHAAASTVSREVESGRRSLSLLVMSPAGTTTVRVPEDGVLVLGRSLECDVTIDDARLSRRHAELRCSGARIDLVDLGSRNGCYVRDARLAPDERAPIRVGDAISMGSSVLVLQRSTAVAGQPPRVWTHGYFETKLFEECARADAPFALLRVRFDSPAAAPSHETAGASAPAAFSEWLEDEDVVGAYAPNEYEVLLKRTTLDEATKRARELGVRLEGAHADHLLAIAMHPRDGRTSEALCEHASRALRREGLTTRPIAEPLATGVLARMDGVVRRVAGGQINVLILGETGSGKEVLARRIHALSPRAKMPMVSLNCAALSDALVESELFGHEKGAFTGAQQAKPGLLESADGGTVFLDEIGETSPGLQAKLLRVIEQREVTRVGALRPRTIDVRFLAATNRDLELEIAAGRFRQDFYFRLNGIALSLPPLRERTSEIEPLAAGFVEQACRAVGRARLPRLAPEVLETLHAYAWPGNVRELRNVIERAVLLSSGDVITRDHLPMEKLGPKPAYPTIPVTPPAESDAGDERARIVRALEACVGNQSRAAERLGISRATLIRRLAEYGIARPRKH